MPIPTPWSSSAPRATWPTRRSFPALQAMVKRGHLNVPVIGVAKAGWTLDQLRARARDSLEKHGGRRSRGLRQAVSACCATWTATTRTPRPSRPSARSSAPPQRPAHYLAIPPALFGAGRGATGKSGCAHGARVIIEKPFGRDLASAQALNRILLGTFDETAIFRIDHYLGKRPVHNMLYLPLRQCVPGAVLESPPRRERPDHHGGRFRRPGPRRASTMQAGAIRDVVQNHLFQVLANLAMEPPVRTASVR